MTPDLSTEAHLDTNGEPLLWAELLPGPVGGHWVEAGRVFSGRIVFKSVQGRFTHVGLDGAECPISEAPVVMVAPGNCYVTFNLTAC